MDTQTPDWLHMIDHTADIGIAVQADDMPMLFERAAWGMFHIIAELSNVEPADATEVSVQAPDREALLVRWLSELNFIHQTENTVFSRFEVSACDNTHLAATAWEQPILPGRCNIRTEIKAVTFHQLRIRRRKALWEARVLFDV